MKLTILRNEVLYKRVIFLQRVLTRFWRNPEMSRIPDNEINRIKKTGSKKAC